MPPGRGQPPPAREMPLALRPPERPDRDGILEPHPGAILRARTAATAVTREPHLNAVIPASARTPSDPTSPVPGPGDHAPART
jgi:hypothetical protein